MRRVRPGSISPDNGMVMYSVYNVCYSGAGGCCMSETQTDYQSLEHIIYEKRHKKG